MMIMILGTFSFSATAQKSFVYGPVNISGNVDALGIAENVTYA
jgi:hypothetical protein